MWWAGLIGWGKEVAANHLYQWEVPATPNAAWISALGNSEQKIQWLGVWISDLGANEWALF